MDVAAQGTPERPFQKSEASCQRHHLTTASSSRGLRSLENIYLTCRYIRHFSITNSIASVLLISPLLHAQPYASWKNHQILQWSILQCLYTAFGANPDHIYRRVEDFTSSTINAFTTYNWNLNDDNNFLNQSNQMLSRVLCCEPFVLLHHCNNTSLQD